MTKLRPIRIVLTELDLHVCGMVGVERNNSAYRNKMQLEPYRKDLGYETHIVGATGEFAVSRLCKINWNPVTGASDTQRGDVGALHVKTITNRWHSLIVKPQDPIEFRYVLCFFNPHGPFVDVIGWTQGKYAKQDCFWREKNPETGIVSPAFFVPQNHLLPIQELLEYEQSHQTS